MIKVEREASSMGNEPAGVNIVKEPKKRISYEHKFQKKWLNDSRFSSWISKSQYSVNKAFCNMCNCEVAGSVTLLLRHSNTAKHVKNLKKDQSKKITLNVSTLTGSSFVKKQQVSGIVCPLSVLVTCLPYKGS